MTALTIIPPISITSGMLTTTDVPETDYAAYASGTTYALGARVIVVADHAIYESLAASNLGNTPSTSPTKWIKVSATNRWKLFDTKNSSATTQATSMSYTLTPGKVYNALALFGVGANTVTVTMTDPVDGVVYNEAYSLLGSITGSTWYNWFFDDVESDMVLTITDLPTYGSAALKIDFAVTTGNVSCASLLLGYQRQFGLGVEYGANVGIVDYSRKEANEFGDYDLIERSYSKRFEFSTLILNTEINPLQSLLTKNRATPMVFIGHPNFASTVVFGIYKDFDITISYSNYSQVSFDIEGLS